MNTHTIRITADTAAIRELIDRALSAMQHASPLEDLPDELVEVESLRVIEGEMTAAFVPSDDFLTWVADLEKRAVDTISWALDPSLKPDPAVFDTHGHAEKK